MKRLFLILSLIVLLLPVPSFADPDVTESGQTIEVSGIDGDFTYTTSSMLYGRDGQGARMDWILFVPGTAYATGTAGCYVTIKNGTDAGPVIFYSEESDAGAHGPSIIYYHGTRVKPVIDFSVSSVAHDTSKVIFQLWPQQQ